MAGVKLSIAEEGLSAIQQQLNKVIQRGGNLQPLFANIGEMLILSHDQRFCDQVSPDGEPWAPLSPSYQEKKSKNTDSILKLNNHLGRELGYIATGKDLFFGTPYEYGALHHFGGTSDMRSQQGRIDAIHETVAEVKHL